MPFGVGAPVGVLAVAILAQMAPLAPAAHDVVLVRHQVALLKPLRRVTRGPPWRSCRCSRAHDHRGVRRRGLVQLDVGPADPATSIFMSALSSGISGIEIRASRVLPGPVLTAASTFSTWVPPINDRRLAFFTRCLHAPIGGTRSSAWDAEAHARLTCCARRLA